MTLKEHQYYVLKIERRERQLREYEDCFAEMMKWFTKNRKHLKKLPVSRLPKVPWE